jgi:glycosyltransferase involved in cell wall biosynthesis
MPSVLIVTHSYPLKLVPFQAKFIQDQALLFQNCTEFKIDVLNLTPKTIPFTKRNKFQKAGLNTYGENVHKMNYLSFPRKIFPNIIQHNISNSLLGYLKNRNYDLIHIHWLYPDGLSIKKLKKQGHKVILTIHGSDWYQSLQKKGVKKLVIEALYEVDQILFSGPQLKNDVLNVLPNLEKKSRLVYNFIDCTIYKFSPPDEKQFHKEKLYFDSDKIHALTVASLRHEKGIDILINAIKNVNSTNLHFHIVGLIENTEYSNSIFKAVKSLGLDSIVTFHGLKSPLELLDYYSASDFFILPSRREGFGLALIEAMATGLPVISNPTGIAPSIISEKIGILNSNFLIDSMTNAILHMKNNYYLYNKSLIRKAVIEKFNNDIFKNQLSKIYQELIVS